MTLPVWNQSWRRSVWAALDRKWDVIIIGGGITGVGVLRAAVSAGLSALLLEAADFSSGTSSRSSKLVHGGLRYLYNRQYDVTRESVREREWLLKAAPHLVSKTAFTIPVYSSYKVKPRMFGIGVAMYDLFAHKWDHSSLSPDQILRDYPGLQGNRLMGGFRYYDAEVDDSRLVLRLLTEAAASGATALNYARVERLLCDAAGKVCGVAVRDCSASGSGETLELTARVVVNAAGPFSDDLRAPLGVPARIRQLRGSHLVFSASRFPVPEALTIFHPRDKRAMFVIPWEGVTLVGTTDIDHSGSQSGGEPFCSQEETTYILEAANALYPDLALSRADIISSFAGLRPIIRGTAENPSKESRAHEVWNEHGLITITGGKLTTFRIMAQDALRQVFATLALPARIPPRSSFFDCIQRDVTSTLPAQMQNYLAGRYGAAYQALLSAAKPGELERIPDTPNLWAELRWAARAEAVDRLDDLLLRRARLGLLLGEGLRPLMPRVRTIVQPELGWDDARWQREENAFWKIWQAYYSASPG